MGSIFRPALAFAAVCFLPATGLASSTIVVEDPCGSPETQRLRLPLYPKQPPSESSPTFTLKYRLMNWDAASTKPVVVVIPGGPGGDMLSDAQDNYARIMRSADYPVVLFDPRGTGCSRISNPAGDDEVYLTENSSSDIVALIQHLQLRDYVIYAASYGTAVATIVTSKLEQASLPPRLVILDGALSRSFAEPLGATVGYIQSWNELIQDLPLSVQSQLSSTTLPFGVSAELWGTFIHRSLPNGKEPLKAMLLALTDPASSEALHLEKRLKDPILKMYQEVFERFPGGNSPLALAVQCREFTRHISQTPRLIGGQLDYSLTSSLACADKPMTHPFDSAKWPVKTPILYLQGEEDPNTPIAMARYHFDTQNSADRIFVTVKNEGHVVLMRRFGEGCGTILWSALLEPSIDRETMFHRAISQCSVPVQIERRGRLESLHR
jgi:pimeloyl-ACP methyl ester carboxylesterase